MHLGFTGTHVGTTERQRARLQQIVISIDRYTDSWHHGCCVGADADFHDILNRETTGMIYLHPPSDKKAVAELEINSDRTITLPDAPYLIRNHAIVDACDLLIVCPRSLREVIRSGTWATYRYARGARKPCLMVWP